MGEAAHAAGWQADRQLLHVVERQTKPRERKRREKWRVAGLRELDRRVRLTVRVPFQTEGLPLV